MAKDDMEKNGTFMHNLPDVMLYEAIPFDISFYFDFKLSHLRAQCVIVYFLRLVSILCIRMKTKYKAAVILITFSSRCNIQRSLQYYQY